MAEFRAFVEKSAALIQAKIHLLVIDLPPQVAYVENVGVGNALPDMPIFLRPEIYVPAPLEATYQAAWGVFPKALKGLLGPARPRKKK